LGILFHTVISMNRKPINFRLPLILLESIRRKKITMAEFEFFAKIQDPEVFNNIYPYKFDQEGFDALETGFASYEAKLKDLCGYPIEVAVTDDTQNESLAKICDTVADGFKFYKTVPNLDVMNIPTVDFYVSGDFLIDRVALTKNIRINTTAQDKISSYYEIIKEIIKELAEDKLVILLKNWSASSVLDRNKTYQVYIYSTNSQTRATDVAYSPPDIHYQTCTFTIVINKNLIDSPELYPHLLELLTTPMNSMLDG